MPRTNSRIRLGILIAFILIAGLSITFFTNQSEDLQLPKTVDFNYHIRPILSQNCFVCHGPDTSSRKANLRLDNFEGATSLLENGLAAIVPGKPHKSELIHRITSDDPDLQMPPPEAKKTLSKREVALLKKLIKQGAQWKKHWAFVAPKEPELPEEVVDATPPMIIDHLISEKQKEKNLKPVQLADKPALIRRIAYLLTGLPPTPKALQTFLEDTSSDAYKKMVDSYLSSPRYGERWARHWMDLVRYGEFMGHEFDYPISGAYHYRDYLIRAFNEDVPYDQLVKEHLAGDMLENPRYHPTKGYNESILGTAYFFLGEGKHSPVSIKQEEADRIDNMIDVTSKTFQALTVSCARCHDHKFDPIPTTDYYAMYGMIESSRIGPLPAKKSKDQAEQIKVLGAIKKEIRSNLGAQLLGKGNPASPQFINQLKDFIDPTPDSSKPEKTVVDYQVLGDFRQGDWNGWYTTGWAFGNNPIMGQPAWNKKDQVRLESGFASSRYYTKGIQGVLRSPYFTLKHDSIAVRAAGFNGTIRIIVDNFQLIQNPLYGSLEQIIEEEEWKTYVFDVSMLKGHKAYLEILPGHYGKKGSKNRKHQYLITAEDYIELQYALAFSDKLPQVVPSPQNGISALPTTEKEQAIAQWVEGKATADQIAFVDKALEKMAGRLETGTLSNLKLQYDSLANLLHDPAHFIGASEGDAVFSPVFLRGSINQLSEDTVPHQFLSAVEIKVGEYPQLGSGRMAWAESVVDPSNPLTTRVMVNRLWHYLFGRGIVETVDNFGLQGKLPSHPELLDYLALQFIREGWSIKQMIRHIVLSESFQRATTALDVNQTIDPQNILLHHFPVRRLEGEAIRDGILAVAGCLDLTMYGPSIPIHLTEFMTGRGRPWKSGPIDGAGRRSVYQVIRRNFLPPMMLAFDMPIPFSTFGRRNVTNVPAQSLTLLNDPFVHEMAWSWAQSLLKENKGSVTAKIQEIYWRAFSRKATAEELKSGKAFLENLASAYGHPFSEMEKDTQLWADYCHAIFNLKEFIHLL